LENSKCNMQQINLREQHLSCRKWWMRVMSAAIVSLLCVVFMDHQTQAQMKVDMNPMMQDRYAETRSPEEIFEVFRDRKLNRLQGLEIAEAIIEQSRRTDIPVKTFLGLMRTESNFTVRAVSSSRAMGLMQIHPVTWKRYTEKLSLSCSREEAFRPSVNVMVSAEILRDLYDKYQGMGYQEPELWDHVFSAYYSGEGSVRGGLNRRHRHYVNKVRTHINEYSQKLDG
jgi:soluble lytic murein transglycosylase-like protein